MRTLGQRVYQIDPPSGFAAQVTCRRRDLRVDEVRLPALDHPRRLGRVMGSGATKRLSAVRWGVAGNIVFAWILTIPAAALVAALCYFPVEVIF